MSNVLQLADYRKPAPAPRAPRTDGVYFCLRCQGESFNLAETGAVTCASCGSWMQNLDVAMRT